MLQRLIITLIAATALAGAAHATPLSVINGSHDVNSYGTGNAGIDSFGHTSTLFADTASGYAAALAAGNTILAEQNAVDFAPIADILAFMNAGGRFIAFGDSSIDTQLINPLFGTTLSISSNSTAASWSQTGAVTGTTFADDPLNLPWVSSTHSVTSGALPTGSTVFYSDPTWGVQVFRTVVGNGDFFYIGHDYCCGSTANEDAYLAVLDSAIRFEGASAPIPLPAGFPLLLAGLGGLWAIRRRTAA